MATTTFSKVILAGAGPGDPDLISVKALRAIQQADVILYDALVNPLLLDHAIKGCKVVFVGKRKGNHEYTQEKINALLVYYAQRNKVVLRLKGGDPFVFGRGHEELIHVRKYGIPVEVIPGITSAIAAPSSIGIPITKRGVSESFWVITGTVSSGEISSDLTLAAQSTATIVILMGMTQIDKIMQLFTLHRSAWEPAAIIQHATTIQQSAVVGNVGTLCKLAEDNSIGSPAVIVIGKVVSELSVNEILNTEAVKMKVAV